MQENCDNGNGGTILTAGDTGCNISFSDNGSMFLTLNKTSIHSTICLGSIRGYIVDKTSDGKLYLRTNTGGEVTTFFDKFPRIDFGPFRGDLLTDIGGIREKVLPKVMELV